MYRLESEHYYAVIGEDENLYVNMKNPVDGSDVKLIINRTDEQLIVVVWAAENEREWKDKPEMSMSERWRNMTVEQEEKVDG